jgi:hypothetical protein
MPHGERFHFCLSRRGSVAAVAQEVADVLTGKGYKVAVQDYAIPLTANFIEAMHEAVKHAREMIVLFTADHEASPHGLGQTDNGVPSYDDGSASHPVIGLPVPQARMIARAHAP